MVEDWRLEEARLGQERLDQGRTALLLEHLGTNRPEDLHEGPPQRQRARQQALRQELLTMAGRVCCWGLTPDELATWLIRVAREYGPENLPAYLRRSSEQGDPGTLLRSQKRAEIGAGADSWRDYSPQTEAALEGPYATQVEQLLAGTAMVLAQDHDEHRQRLREELRRMVAIGNQFGAGKVLMQLVGTRRASDDEIAEAVGGALSVTAARTLLEFAA